MITLGELLDKIREVELIDMRLSSLAQQWGQAARSGGDTQALDEEEEELKAKKERLLETKLWNRNQEIV